jgi:hypothetical protein
MRGRIGWAIAEEEGGEPWELGRQQEQGEQDEVE